MSKIKVTDKSRGAQKIKVRGVTLPLKDMSDEDIIRRTNFKQEMLDYHYAVNNEYKDISDLYSQSMVEFMADVLFSYCQDENWDDEYAEMAERLIDECVDDVIDEIYARDDDTASFIDAREEARRGDY